MRSPFVIADKGIIPFRPSGVKLFLKDFQKKIRATRSDSYADLYPPLYPGMYTIMFQDVDAESYTNWYANAAPGSYADSYADLDTSLSTELYTVGRQVQVPTPKSEARFAREPTTT